MLGSAGRSTGVSPIWQCTSPQPSTLNPKPKTLNPNPKPEMVEGSRAELHVFRVMVWGFRLCSATVYASSRKPKSLNFKPYSLNTKVQHPEP